MSIKQTLISFLLITTFHISFGQLFDPKEIPSRFWFNTSGKNGISVGYAVLEMKHVSSTVGKLNLNIPKMGITISSQNTYEWLK